MKIKWKKKAQTEYRKHILYCLREFGRFTTLRFQEKIEKQLGLLEVFPYMGKVEPLLVGRRFEYRSLVVHPFLKLVYYINETKERIVIANLWDTRQEPRQLTEGIS